MAIRTITLSLKSPFTSSHCLFRTSQQLIEFFFAILCLCVSTFEREISEIDISMYSEYKLNILMQEITGNPKKTTIPLKKYEKDHQIILKHNICGIISHSSVLFSNTLFVLAYTAAKVM